MFGIVWRRPLIGRHLHSNHFRSHRPDVARRYIVGAGHYTLFKYVFELVAFGRDGPVRMPWFKVRTVDGFEFGPLQDDPRCLQVCHGLRSSCREGKASRQGDNYHQDPRFLIVSARFNRRIATVTV